MTPRTIPIEDILAGVEKAVQSVPVEMAEKARQETVRITKSSSRPRDLTRAEKEALRTLKKNTDLSILPAGKSNATMILNTVDYKQKIISHPEDPLTLILRLSRTGTVWFYTYTSNKRAARPKLYTKSLTRDLKPMYSRLTLVRISIKL